MIKHYVEFDMPGSFMPETEVGQVKTRIPANIREVPEYTYAIEYFDREEVKKNGEILQGRAKNRSTRIIFGEVFSKEQLPNLGFGKHTPLYSNADNTDGRVIKCITGNWQPWDKDWIILSDYSKLNGYKEAL